MQAIQHDELILSSGVDECSNACAWVRKGEME